MFLLFLMYQDSQNNPLLPPRGRTPPFRASPTPGTERQVPLMVRTLLEVSDGMVCRSPETETVVPKAARLILLYNYGGVLSHSGTKLLILKLVMNNGVSPMVQRVARNFRTPHDTSIFVHILIKNMMIK